MNLSLHPLLGRIILAMLILSITDFSIGVFFGLFLPLMPLDAYTIAPLSAIPIEYFSHKSSMRIASDLAFIEGAAIFFVGAIMAFYRSTLSSTAKALMIIGIATIGLSVLFGIFA